MKQRMFDEDDFFKSTYPLPPPRPYSFHNCDHWREPVRVGRYIVTCSAHLSSKGLPPPAPDFGIYLAYAWRDILGKMWTNGSYLKRLAIARPYPALVADWPDGGVIPVAGVNTLVEICLSKMRRGKRIDLGCMAAHGRTGTLLACLIARVEHLSGTDALKAVRSRYCKWAVEHRNQEQLIEEYVKRYGVRRKRNGQE